MNWLLVAFVAVWSVAMTLLSEALINLLLQADVGAFGFLLFAAWNIIGFSAVQATRARL